MKWYVLNVLSGKENTAVEHLESEIRGNHLESRVVEIIIPKERYVKVINKKKVRSERNWFPGYILIQAKMDGEVARILQNTPNVIGFLGGKTPVPLRESEVVQFLGQIDDLSMQEEEVPVDAFLIGETVKIIDGPFLEFFGTVARVDNTKKRVHLEVKVFQRKTPVDLGFEQVVRVGD